MSETVSSNLLDELITSSPTAAIHGLASHGSGEVASGEWESGEWASGEESINYLGVDERDVVGIDTDIIESTI